MMEPKQPDLTKIPLKEIREVTSLCDELWHNNYYEWEAEYPAIIRIVWDWLEGETVPHTAGEGI